MWADPPISVALVEDDAATRERLTHVLAAAPGIALVHTAASAGQMLDWLAGNSVNVLLVDLGLPDQSGLEVIRWCRAHQPATNVMVVTLFGDEANMIGAFEAGARGYLLKDGTEDELARHVLSLHAGGSPMTPVIARQLLARLAPGEVEAVLAHELGHYAHRHVIKRIVLVFFGSLIILATLGYLIDTPWFFNGLGLTTRNTALALILFLLVLPVFIFLLTPLFSQLSRRDEFQADRYASTHASADELIAALVKLYEDNAATLTPDPLHSLFYDSHPPASVRIAQLQAR